MSKVVIVWVVMDQQVLFLEIKINLNKRYLIIYNFQIFIFNNKITYYERTVKQLEKERSELMVRATMAEEQLKSLTEHLSKTTLDYQRKIMELKRVINLFTKCE